ncbi:MAG TPA: ABC transporter ATP-binding protein [Actinomycetota bacterium]|nr:ABC transporter ATP-binding protein [Actinomycetota bacterium]
MSGTPLLEVRDLRVRFGPVRAVDGVSLAVPHGPFGLGVVGESGSGKTSLGRAILRLVPVAEGAILFEGRDVLRASGEELRRYRRAVQIVFQDPDSSLDPRMRVRDAVAEALRAHRIVPRSQLPARIRELFEEVALDPVLASRYPHQLSGGQRQRVAIARALAVGPRMLVLDEPTSALDVTVQARILELIDRLRRERGLAYLLISHNLAVVERLCEEIAVMYLGRVVEEGPTAPLLARPAHPYTVALRSAVPEIDLSRRRSRLLLPGTIPDPANPPPGCHFHPRCPLAIERCRTEVPAFREVLPGRKVACHRAEEVLSGHPMLPPAMGTPAASEVGGSPGAEVGGASAPPRA